MRMKKSKSLLSYWAPSLLWMGLIFFLSSFPKLQVSEGLADLILRKLAHMVEYAILFLLLFRALRNTSGLSKSAVLGLSLMASVLYAASDEYHQRLVPGRHGCLSDVGIDSLGAALGLASLSIIIPRLPDRAKHIILGEKQL